MVSKASGHRLLPNPESGSYDAFARLRISSPESLYYSTMQYGYDVVDDEMDRLLQGDASSADESSGHRLITQTGGDLAVLQSLLYARYQPGKSQYVKITGVFGASETATTKRMGYFDDNNGIYLQQAPEGTISLGLRNGGVDTVVDQSVFSYDSLDSFDFTRAIIFLLDIEWLGVGTVRCGFIQDGHIRMSHFFHHAGIVSAPYMQTATLPVRWEVSQDDVGGGSMLAICAAVDAEGGATDEFGHPMTISNLGTGVSCPVAVDTPVLAIRPALTLNGHTNRIGVKLDNLSIYVTGNPALVRVNAHGAVSGGAWSAVNGHSAMEYNVTATGHTGGHDINTSYVPTSGTGTNSSGGKNLGLTGRIPIALDIAGTDQSRGLCVTGRGVGGTSVVYVAANWREYR